MQPFGYLSSVSGKRGKTDLSFRTCRDVCGDLFNNAAPKQ